MQFSSTTLVTSLLAVLGSSSLASAVCTGDQFAIGTPSANAATGLTTCMYRTGTLIFMNSVWVVIGPFQIINKGHHADTIYTAGTCAVSHTLAVSTTNPTVCDSQYFACAVGTTNIDEYDDPVTGTSYICAADTLAEKCGSDTITYCVSLLPTTRTFDQVLFCPGS